MVTIKMECKDCGCTEGFVYVYKEGREPDVIDKIVCGHCNCVVSRIYRKYVHGNKLKSNDEEDDPLPELRPLIKKSSSLSISSSEAQSSQSPSYRPQEV